MVIYLLDSIIRPLNYVPLRYFQEDHSVIVHALLDVKKTKQEGNRQSSSKENLQ